MSEDARQLTITRLGQRGEGIAQGADGLIFVPYALAGDIIRAEVSGTRGRLLDIITPSAERIDAICPYFSTCGGCAVQTLAPPSYTAWKRNLVVEALRHAGVEANVSALVEAHGEGRRRATFHARFDAHGKARSGFMRARLHDIVEIETCAVLAPAMAGAIAVARVFAAALAAARKPLDIAITATRSGLDVDIRGSGPLEPAAVQKLIHIAEEHDLARLSNHGDRLIERRAPILPIGKAQVVPPPGAFLQATEAGETLLAATVMRALAGSRRIADLFSGVGTFALRLAEHARVHAVDVEEAPLAALMKAARATPGLKEVTIERRDLFRRPLDADALAAFDAIVFDPPRAGAQAQAEALAKSAVERIAAVSCDVQSFARDAALLCAGGYEIEAITPFDQFRYSPHVEIVGVFRRQPAPARRRGLLA